MDGFVRELNFETQLHNFGEISAGEPVALGKNANAVNARETEGGAALLLLFYFSRA